MEMHFRVSLWNLKHLLIEVDLETIYSAELEIDVCHERIKKVEASHVTVESLSYYGCANLPKLREKIFMGFFGGGN